MNAARAILAILVAAILAACGDPAVGEAPEEPRRYTPDDLAGIVLGPDEAPGETDYLIELSGTLRLDELWPIDCCPTQQEEFDDAGFAAAHGSFFQRPGHSADPVDTRDGVEIMNTTAVLFVTDTGASEAMASWMDYFESPVLEPLPTDGLGEEAIAVTGSPNAPAEVFFLYLWRIDRLLLGVRVSAGRETIAMADVRAVVDLMDARAT